MWEDVVIAIVQWVFAIALIPSILHKTEKPALMTSLLTGLLLIVLCVAYASLDLWKSVIPVAILTLAWLYLAWQRYQLNKKDVSNV